MLVVLICVESFALHSQSKTSFQIAEKWLPNYDIRTDIAMLYGMDSTFAERYATWKAKDYQIQFMTGIAWGDYQNYFTGKFDGKTHFNDAQVNINGDTIWHSKNVPYVIPSGSYLNYIIAQVKKAIDMGATAIYLEEPEYWAEAGYSDAFKAEWRKYYGSPWVAQHSSPEATYMSSKLKYQLFYNALNKVFSAAKEYALAKGQEIKCFVPTHSLLNYSVWQIVSPEASLASLPVIDGYIAQVWTGTSRSPVFFDGIKKERVFENAFLEYGTVYSMVAPTQRTVYFLTDPIEDGVRTWDDYKRNYQATFTAELLYPSVNQYEVMPWPNRIYLGKFPVEGKTTLEPINPDYATQMQVMINSLGDMPLSTNKINGTQGIGLLLANSIMFQRFPIHQDYDDPQLSNFYGMALPLLKRGIPVEMVHIENLGFSETLRNIKVLVMSYSNMKPLNAESHLQLAKWVKNGGIIVYISRDDDPFQTVKEWWNTKGNNYKTPSEHLFQQLKINVTDLQTCYSAGKGYLYVIRQNPKELVMEPDQDEAFVNTIQSAYEKTGSKSWLTKNYFYLERGPYTIASVLTENKDTSSLVIEGQLIDLFDPSLPILNQKRVQPGEQAFLYDVSKVENRKIAKVLCSASRIYDEKQYNSTYTFTAKSPSNTNNVMRISLPEKPDKVNVLNTPFQQVWDDDSQTLLLKFANKSEGVQVKISW